MSEKEKEKEKDKEELKEEKGKNTKEVKVPDSKKVGYCDCCCVRYHDLKKVCQ